MFEAFCKEKLGPLALRLAVGLVCIFHGYIKIMSAGGTSWNPDLGVGWQLLIAWGEFFGGLAILAGFRCRWAAGVILILNVGLVGWSQGSRVLDQPLRSLEPTFLLLLTGMALLFLGGGELAMDRRGGGGSKPARRK